MRLALSRGQKGTCKASLLFICMSSLDHVSSFLGLTVGTINHLPGIPCPNSFTEKANKTFFFDHLHLWLFEIFLLARLRIQRQGRVFQKPKLCLHPLTEGLS